MNEATEKARLVYEIDIELPEQKNVMNHLTTLMAKAIVLENPGGARVSAPSGYGKSFLINKIRDLHPVGVENGQTVLPVLSIRMDKSPTADSVTIALLEALHFPFANKQSQKERIALIVDAMAAARVRLVTMDETNYVCAGNRRIASDNVCAVIREIYDVANVPWAFFGTERLETAFEWYPPLRERCSAYLPQSGFTYGPSFLKVLEEYDAKLPFEKPAGLAEKDTAEKLAEAIDGSHRALKTILRNATLMAALEGANQINRKHLAQGFIQWGGSKTNPFK